MRYVPRPMLCDNRHRGCRGLRRGASAATRRRRGRPQRRVPSPGGLAAGRQLIPAHAQLQDPVHKRRRCEDVHSADQVGRRQLSERPRGAVEQSVHPVGDGSAGHRHDHAVHGQRQHHPHVRLEPRKKQRQHYRRIADKQTQNTDHDAVGKTAVPIQRVPGVERSNECIEDNHAHGDAQRQHQHGRCHKLTVREPCYGFRFSHTLVGVFHRFVQLCSGAGECSPPIIEHQRSSGKLGPFKDSISSLQENACISGTIKIRIGCHFT